MVIKYEIFPDQNKNNIDDNLPFSFKKETKLLLENEKIMAKDAKVIAKSVEAVAIIPIVSSLVPVKKIPVPKILSIIKNNNITIDITKSKERKKFLYPYSLSWYQNVVFCVLLFICLNVLNFLSYFF